MSLKIKSYLYSTGDGKMTLFEKMDKYKLISMPKELVTEFANEVWKESRKHLINIILFNQPKDIVSMGVFITKDYEPATLMNGEVEGYINKIALFETNRYQEEFQRCVREIQAFNLDLFVKCIKYVDKITNKNNHSVEEVTSYLKSNFALPRFCLKEKYYTDAGVGFFKYFEPKVKLTKDSCWYSTQKQVMLIEKLGAVTYLKD